MSTLRFISGDPVNTMIRTTTLITSTMPDPQLSTAKRQQRTQAFSSHLAHASLERQLAAAQTTKLELESKLREKDLLIERLEGDRRWLAEREKEEREEKEREREEAIEAKVRSSPLGFMHRVEDVFVEESRQRAPFPPPQTHGVTR